MIRKVTLFVSILLLTVACTPKPQQRESRAEVSIPSFNADSAYTYVENQVAFGPRVPNTKAHAFCLDYFLYNFGRWCDTVVVNQGVVELYDGSVIPCKNLVASIAPNKASRVMVCSHWDSRPFSDAEADKTLWNKPILGADDGASGVGVIMELARAMSIAKPNIGVDFILFDVEDWGTPEFYKGAAKEDSWCLGAQYWARNPHHRGYRARYGVLLDMVGGSGATFYREQVSDYFAQHVVEKVWSEARCLGYGNYFVNEKGGAVTDDHLYVNQLAGVHCIDIIRYEQGGGFSPYWHTQKDDMRNIDKQTLMAVGQTLMNVIYKEK